MKDIKQNIYNENKISVHFKKKSKLSKIVPVPVAYFQTAHHLSPRLAVSKIGEPDKSATPCPSGCRVYNVTLQTLKEIRLNKVLCLIELRSKGREKNKSQRCSF